MRNIEPNVDFISIILSIFSVIVSNTLDIINDLLLLMPHDLVCKLCSLVIVLLLFIVFIVLYFHKRRSL